MATVTLTRQAMEDGGERLKLVSPYHPALPPKARALGGRFNAETKAWYFDPRDAERVRALCLETYGTDPLAEAPAETVTVRLSLDRPAGMSYADYAALPIHGQSIHLLGRELAYRPGRDSSVRLGEGVIAAEGGFAPSGGSMKHPAVQPLVGTVLEVRDVPKALAEQAAERYPELIEIVAGTPEAPAVLSAVEQIAALARALTPEQRAAAVRAIEALGVAEAARA